MCKIWKGVTPIPPTTQPKAPLPSPSPYPTKMRQTYLAETYQSIRNSHSIGIRMWILACVFKSIACTMEHYEQLYGFPRVCCFKWPKCAKTWYFRNSCTVSLRCEFLQAYSSPMLVQMILCTVNNFKLLTNMNVYMLLQIVCSCKWFGTQRTNVGFLSIVSSYMSLQIDCLCKGFGTLRTTVGFLSIVNSYMHL